MDQFIELLRSLRNLKHPEMWVTKAGGLRFAAILAAAVGLYAYGVEDLPRKWQLTFIVGTFVLSFGIWALVREVYWRFGGGFKVGVTYVGHRVPFDDWIQTRNELRRLAETRAVSDRISIRLLPETVTETETRWQRVERRYKFSMLLRVEVEALLKDPEQSEMTCTIRASAKAAMARGFVDATSRHMQTFFVRKIDAKTAKDILRLRAASVFETILLVSGSFLFAEGRYSEASQLLDALDQQLNERLKINENPRRAIRWLHSQCLMASSSYPGDSPPTAEDLAAVVAQSQTAADRYAEEFPYILLSHARNLYYFGDLESALSVAKRARSSNLLTNLGRLYADLNLAVLYLFSNSWKEAAQKLREFLDGCNIATFNWKDVIRFADFARDYGHKPAIYLQVLYRKLGKQEIPVRMLTDLDSWLSADHARAELSRLRDERFGKADCLRSVVARPKRNRKKAG
jgi:hypothetical protein